MHHFYGSIVSLLHEKKCSWIKMIKINTAKRKLQKSARMTSIKITKITPILLSIQEKETGNEENDSMIF